MNARSAGMAGAAIAALLPLLLIFFPTSLSASDPEAYAALSGMPSFDARRILTFLYFPAAIAALFGFGNLMNATDRTIYWLGFVFFCIGNAIDSLFRSIQFLILHGSFAGALSGQDGSASWAAIQRFEAIAPAFGATFGFWFALARLMFAYCAWRSGDPFVRAAGIVLGITGLQNLLPQVDALLFTKNFTWAGQFYFYPWLAGFVLIFLALWRRKEA